VRRLKTERAREASRYNFSRQRTAGKQSRSALLS
jgi:hypothetical protein